MKITSDYKIKLIEKKYLTEDTIFFSFKAPEGFSFQAGQYILFKAVRENEFKWRAYSILNPPSKKGFIDLCVKIIPQGFASGFFEKLSVGQEVEMKGPLGEFLFEKSEKNHYFICVGTGVVPFYSMIQEFLHQFPRKNFTLLWGLKYRKDLFFQEELQRMTRQYPHFTYMPTLTREEWDGKMGRVQRHLEEDLQQKMFYLCGLKEFVLGTVELLKKRGVPENKIKFERYS